MKEIQTLSIFDSFNTKTIFLVLPCENLAVCPKEGVCLIQRKKDLRKQIKQSEWNRSQRKILKQSNDAIEEFFLLLSNLVV